MGEPSPAPWEWDEADGTIRSADGACVAVVQPHGNVNTIARTGEHYSHADARRIAATPDLLEAARAVADRLDYLRALWGDEGVTRTLRDTLRAAIDRACPGGSST